MNPRGTCYNLGGTVNSVEQTRKERKRERNRERPKDGVSGVKKTVFSASSRLPKIENSIA